MFLRRALLLGFPFVLILGTYFLVNPFGILPYSVFPNSIAETSTDITFTRKLLKTYKSENYNSFIFGNSRANAFIHNYSDYFANDRLIALNAPGESIRNIYYKIHLLDSIGLKIKYAFIHMDDALIGNVNNSKPHLQGPAYIHHPLTATSTVLKFQLKGIGFFFDKFYFFPYMQYLFAKTYCPYMKNYFKDSYGENKLSLEEQVEQLQDKYYVKYADLFTERKEINKYLNCKLDVRDIILLKEISEIFKKHKTDYRICFSINYYMRKMDLSVLNEFRSIFDKERVFDFTGRNKMSEDLTNFYETSHFRSKAGKMQLDSIFSQNR